MWCCTELTAELSMVRSCRGSTCSWMWATWNRLSSVYYLKFWIALSSIAFQLLYTTQLLSRTAKANTCTSWLIPSSFSVSPNPSLSKTTKHCSSFHGWSLHHTQIPFVFASVEPPIENPGWPNKRFMRNDLPAEWKKSLNTWVSFSTSYRAKQMVLIAGYRGFLNESTLCRGIKKFRIKMVPKRRQWRSQPDNLVPLCKFKVIIIIHFFKNLIVFTVNKHENICIAGNYIHQRLSSWESRVQSLVGPLLKILK